VEVARAKGAEALRSAFCAYSTRGLDCAAFRSSREPQPPRLSSSGFNKFVMMGSGRTWLLYLDLSDWAPDSAVRPTARIARSKILDGAVADMSKPTGATMRISESSGATMTTYLMMHPAMEPGKYNLSGDASGDSGLRLAEVVAESPGYQTMKGECQHGRGPGQGESMPTSASSIAFDCDDGTFLWTVAGWRVATSADGTIKAFVFANASATEVVGGNKDEDDDNSATSFHYRVLSFTDGGDERADFGLSRAFQEGSIFTGCVESNDTRRMSGRLLATSRRLLPAAVLPNTNWCGPGTCGADIDGCRMNYCLDAYDGDWACRRHDACTKNADMLGIPILGCSCNRDLDVDRGSGPNAVLIHSLFGSYGAIPCISHEKHCRTWGWVESGRRRRGGWSYFGVTGKRKCDDWNWCGDKYSDSNMQNFGYVRQINDYDLNSRSSWPNCQEQNTDHIDLGNPFGMW